MKKVLGVIFALALVCVLAGPIATKATTSTSAATSAQELLIKLQIQITALKAQIAALTTQIESLRQAKNDVKDATKDVKTTLQLIRDLKVGMSGDDIKTLQELLSTDSDVYPEGLVTGYYGKLTEKAVKKLQKKLCLNEDGTVNPQTIKRINELLSEGAGNSGHIPAGLLIAPGIQKKLCGTTTPATTTPDTAAPVISNVFATNTTATATKIKWTTNEKANSRVWYGAASPITAATPTDQVSSNEYELSHSLTLSGLASTTTYYYVVVSADKAGNITTAPQQSFITAGQ
jgi:peptidoglycan hydrolase-like protein with peptidoglycan-binding domain